MTPSPTITRVKRPCAEARTSALVSETPLAGREHQDAQRHADAMVRHRADVLDQIGRLEQTQDDLLDRLMAETRS